MKDYSNEAPVGRIASTNLNRRSLLKSAGVVAIASTIGSGLPAKLSAANTPENADMPSSTSDNIGANRDFLTPMVGFMLAHEQFPVPELVQLGVTAEQAGFDLLANSDHLQPWQANEHHVGEAWITMSALGERTRNVWIGPMVTCPTLRYNPAVVAEAFASLSMLYPERIFLGVGSGEALNEQAATGVWPKWEERSERLIEATAIIRQLWTGKQVSHRGKYYSVNTKLYGALPTPPPLLMAANGPKAMHRAGQYGDGVITDPKTWKQHKAEFEAGAKAAGKNPRRMPVLIEQFVVVGNQQDAEQAAQLWRFIPKAFKRYYNFRDPEVIQERAAAEIPLQSVYAEWPVSTDPDVHVKTLMELFKEGATIVNVHSGQNDQKRVIEFYGNHVLPRVHQQLKEA
jgi:TAT-translocated FGD2 family F420-dependent dehydrogenase